MAPSAPASQLCGRGDWGSEGALQLRDQVLPWLPFPLSIVFSCDGSLPPVGTGQVYSLLFFSSPTL